MTEQPLTKPRIDKAGIYPDITMTAYHDNLCAGPSVSGSGLHTIEVSCEAAFYEQSYFNPNRPEEKDTEPKAIGRAAHKLILEGRKAFDESYIVDTQSLNRNSNAWKAFLTDAQLAGKEVLRVRDAQMIDRMALAIEAHPQAGKAFASGIAEPTLVWQDEATGIYLKARPDFLPNNGVWVPNYKSAENAKPDEWVRRCFAYGYHQSAALAVEGLRRLWSKDAGQFFVVQEKEAPYLVSIAVLDDDAMQWGAMLNRRALDKLARCLASGRWPGYEGVATVGMPKWQEMALLKRSEAGDFEATPSVRISADMTTAMQTFHAPLNSAATRG